MLSSLLLNGLKDNQVRSGQYGLRKIFNTAAETQTMPNPAILHTHTHTQTHTDQATVHLSRMCDPNLPDDARLQCVCDAVPERVSAFLLQRRVAHHVRHEPARLRDNLTPYTRIRYDRIG